MSSDQLEPKKRGGVRKKASGKQKRPRRSDFEFQYLEPSVALLRRRQEVEDVASYVHKLSPEEKAWMNQFMKEYNDAGVDENSIFHSKDEILKDKDGNVIMTTNNWGVVTDKSVPLTSYKLCTDRNNSRNRCDYTAAEAMNMLTHVESDYEMERLLYNGGELEDENSINTEDDFS